jgi:hypothetical protein
MLYAAFNKVTGVAIIEVTKMDKSFSKKAVYGYIISFFLLYVIFLLVLNPEKYINSVYRGMLMFALNVLPALFPFFF